MVVAPCLSIPQKMRCTRRMRVKGERERNREDIEVVMLTCGSYCLEFDTIKVQAEMVMPGVLRGIGGVIISVRL